MKKTYLKDGDILELVIGYSEAAIYTKIAGTVQTVKVIADQDKALRSGYIVNIHTLQPTGGAFLLAELGIYSDQQGPYITDPAQVESLQQYNERQQEEHQEDERTARIANSYRNDPDEHRASWGY